MCCQQQQLHVQLGFSKYRLPRMRPEQRERAVLLSQDSVSWSHIAFNNLDATLQVNRADIRPRTRRLRVAKPLEDRLVAIRSVMVWGRDLWTGENSTGHR